MRYLERCLVLCLALAFAVPTNGLADELGPQPGDVYREFSVHNGGNFAWRVTAEDVKRKDAKKFLPNPILDLKVYDLKGAVRAEALIDRWGGHHGTKDKRIRFNENAWISVPELSTVSTGKHPSEYYSQDNPIIPVPLEDLKVGINKVEGGIGPGNVGHWWGQWGLYSVILRVYYAPDKIEWASGKIVQPAAGATIGEDSEVIVECSTNTARVDVIAWYDGYDDNGDGVYLDWHRTYHQPLRGMAAEMRDHVGTVIRPAGSPALWKTTWNTRFVPDQAPGQVRFISRIQHENGIWSVSEPVEGLSLVRQGVQVKQYRATEVPPSFGVRNGSTKTCQIPIPKEANLENAQQAVLHYRTWNGYDHSHDPFKLNGHSHKNEGLNHHFDYDLLPIDVSELKHENTFSVHSETKHHHLEVLWPGPALTVRYRIPTGPAGSAKK